MESPADMPISQDGYEPPLGWAVHAIHWREPITLEHLVNLVAMLAKAYVQCAAFADGG